MGRPRRGRGELSQPEVVIRCRAELGVYAEITRTLGRASLQAGARLDAAGETRVWQPRARVAMPVATGVSVGLAAGRTTRLYHLVSDPQSEPDFAFYDFWLNAGDGGIPGAAQI